MFWWWWDDGGGPTPPPPLEGPFSIFMGETPEPGQDTEDSGVNLGVRFRSSRPGELTGVRWFAVDPGSGIPSTPEEFGIFSASGSLLISVSPPALFPTAGWHDVLFDEPLPIAADAEMWLVALLSGNHWYRYISGFAGWNPTAYEPIVANGAGFAVGSTLMFPSTSYTSLYGVDVIAMTEPE